MYTTVYELDSQALWKAYLTGGGFAEMAILVAIAVLCALFGMLRRRPLWLLPLLPALLMVSIFAPVLQREIGYGRRMLDLYSGGMCDVAEGTTHVVAQQRLEGHSIDRIEIGGVPLEVSHYEIGPQYRDSIVFGGTLKEGVEARVWYCPQMAPQSGSPPIVRVDVKRVTTGE